MDYNIILHGITHVMYVEYMYFTSIYYSVWFVIGVITQHFDSGIYLV